MQAQLLFAVILHLLASCSGSDENVIQRTTIASPGSGSINWKPKKGVCCSSAIWAINVTGALHLEFKIPIELAPNENDYHFRNGSLARLFLFENSLEASDSSVVHSVPDYHYIELFFPQAAIKYIEELEVDKLRILVQGPITLKADCTDVDLQYRMAVPADSGELELNPDRYQRFTILANSIDMPSLVGLKTAPSSLPDGYEIVWLINADRKAKEVFFYMDKTLYKVKHGLSIYGGVQSRPDNPATDLRNSIKPIFATELAGALYAFNTDTVRIVLNVKELTDGDDRNKDILKSIHGNGCFWISYNIETLQSSNGSIEMIDKNGELTLQHVDNFLTIWNIDIDEPIRIRVENFLSDRTVQIISHNSTRLASSLMTTYLTGWVSPEKLKSNYAGSIDEFLLHGPVQIVTIPTPVLFLNIVLYGDKHTANISLKYSVFNNSDDDTIIPTRIIHDNKGSIPIDIGPITGDLSYFNIFPTLSFSLSNTANGAAAWTIKVKPGQKVQLNLKYFVSESLQDRLKIFTKANPKLNSSPAASYSPNSTLSTMTFRSTVTVVLHSTEPDLRYRMFKMDYEVTSD